MKWISVDERLPEPGSRVLFAGAAFVGEGYIDDEGVWNRYYCGKVAETLSVEVSCWMPLPAPPKEAD